ncbi:MAG: carboxypeptidase-like regulatory domain-containing protein [Proteobacteria bacterium]|nr:carboxypeptidase-like regulatory domain-containing protein [Pseudomonadota bacterium]
MKAASPWWLAAHAIAALLVASVSAQSPPPSPAKTPARGPRDLIVRGQQVRDQRQMRRALEAKPPKPDGTPAAAERPVDPHVDPHRAGAGGHTAAAQPASHARSSSSVPVGEIHVRVLDAANRPVAGAEVRLGTLTSTGKGVSQRLRSDAAGQVRFSGLGAGAKQAYRVSLSSEGATYAAAPFRLPAEQGYEVTLRRLPVTRDARLILLVLGQVSVEVADDRLKVNQQVRLANLGQATYVFPPQGRLLRLPDDALAFRSREVMSDQKVTFVRGEGIRIAGSLPPGATTLAWGFDVPLPGARAELSLDVPFKVYSFRVLGDYAPGMVLRAEGFPGSQVFEDRGRQFQATQITRTPQDPPLRRVKITLEGIPGPGPWRWIASGAALLAIALGFVLSASDPERDAARQRKAARARKEQLLEQVERLGEQRERNEIGPEYFRRQLRSLLETLTALLHQEQRHKERSHRSGAQRSSS